MANTLCEMEQGRSTGADATRPNGRQGSGLKSFRCGDVVPGCTMTCEGSESEIMARVQEHASRDHGIQQLDDDLVERVRRAVRPT